MSRPCEVATRSRLVNSLFFEVTLAGLGLAEKFKRFTSQLARRNRAGPTAPDCLLLGVIATSVLSSLSEFCTIEVR